MSSRWHRPFDGMEDRSSKRVPEGLVFRAPHPWVFGRGRTYLLKDDRSFEIAAQLRRMWRSLFAVGVPAGEH